MNRSLLGAFLTSALFLAGCGGSGMNSALPTASGNQPTTNSNERVTSDFQRGLALGHFTASCAQGGEEARCFAYVLTQSGRTEAAQRGTLGHSTGVTPNATPSGYGPAQLQAAYGTAPASGGSGRTVAIVDAYDNPNLEADLGVYRSTYGLPACTTANGCFKKVGQTGTSTLPSNNASWGQETSLDVDMVSANCPNCKILVVEVEVGQPRQPRGRRQHRREPGRGRDLEQLRRRASRRASRPTARPTTTPGSRSPPPTATAATARSRRRRTRP